MDFDSARSRIDFYTGDGCRADAAERTLMR